ncbi:CFI-box-CTERM domain-containing protein [Planctomycetota bacterium]
MTSTAWETPANWNLGVVPGAGGPSTGYVVIPGSLLGGSKGYPVINGGIIFPCTTINIVLGGKLTISANTVPVTNMTVSGLLEMDGGVLQVGGNFTVTGTGDITGGKIVYNGTGAQTVAGIQYYDLDIDKAGGTATWSAGTLNVAHDFRIIKGTFACTQGAGVFVVDNNVTMVSDANAIWNPGSCLFTVKGNWVKGANAVFNPDTSQVSFEGTTNTTINSTNFNILNIKKSNAKVTLLGAITTENDLNVTIATGSGNPNNLFMGSYNHVARGDVYASGSNPGNMGTLYLETSTLEVQGTAGLTDADDHPSAYNYGTGKIIFGGANDQSVLERYNYYELEINKSGGTATLAGPITVKDHLRLYGGTLDTDSNNDYQITVDTMHILFSAGNLNANGSLILLAGDFAFENDQGNFDAGTSTLELNGNGDQAIDGWMNGPQTFYNVRINKGAGTATMVCKADEINTILNDLTIDQGIFGLAIGPCRVGGNWTHNGGTFDPSDQEVRFFGATSPVAIKGAVATDFYDLRILKTDQTDVVKLQNDSTVSNELLLTTGTLQVEVPDLPGGGGTWFLNEDGTTVNYASNAGQNIGNTQYYNLEINKSAGTAALAGNVDVTNVLTLTQGTMELGANTLTLSNDSTVAAAGILHLDDPASILKLADTKGLTVSGKLLVDPAGGNATIQSVAGNISLAIAAGQLDIDGLNIMNLNASGMDIASGVTFTNFKNISFLNSLGGADSQHLKITTDDSVREIFEDMSFDDSTTSTGGYNVTVVDTIGGSDTSIFIPGAAGAGGGEDFDNDDDANDDGVADTGGGVIAWVAAALLPELTVDITESGSDDSYTVSLIGKPTKTVAINISTDGQALVTPTMLIYTPSSWFTPQTVTVTAVNDEYAEGNHISTISHSVSTIDPYYSGMSIANVTANITDNETAGVSITESGGSTDVQEGSTTDTYTVILISKPTANVTVTITPDADSTVDVNPLTFTDLNWNVAQTVEVTPVDDADSEGDHTSTISHTVTSTDNQYDGFLLGNVTANITDDEPFADAGDDYAANPGLLYLDGTDSSGLSTLSYSWTQTGGASVTIINSTTATPNFYAYAAGAYTFQLTVTDQALNNDNDTVTVTVQNVVPVAVPAPEYYAMEIGENKQLSGTDSYDANGTAIDTYTWALIGANNPVADINTVVDNAASSTPVFTPTTAGVYNISLIVNAGGQNSTLSGITIVVNNFAGTLAPVAYAGPDRIFNLNTLVTLYGHDSLDADSLDEYPDLAFTWRQIAGPAVALSDTSVPQPTFTPVVAGWYTFGLIVRDAADDNLYSEEDTVTVLAFDKNTNYPPTAVPELKTFTDTNLDGEINAEETFTLTAINSEDPDEDNLTVTWQQIFGPGFYTILPSETATEITFTPMLEGTYVFQLTVNDGSVDSAAVNIEVQVAEDDTEPPVATALANGYAALSINTGGGGTITLDGTQSTGTDGQTYGGLTFHWRQTQGPTVDINNANSSIATCAPTISRTYEFQLTVTDPYGVTASDTVLVAVSSYDAAFNPTGNNVPKPVISAPPLSYVGEDVILNASGSYDDGSDPDGVNNQNDGLEIFWFQAEGPMVDLNTGDPFNVIFTPQLAGTYKFECYVDDGADISPPAEITVEIEEVMPPPGVTIVKSANTMQVTEGNSSTYTIVLDSKPAATVIITITADYQATATPSTLTFTQQTWNIPQTVTLTAKDDAVSESTHSSTVTHSAGSSDNDYEGISISSVSMQIIDNDAAIGGGSSSSVVSGGGGGGGGCFIATAAYGSYTEKHVMLLRQFRDKCLLTNVPGRWFVDKYYKYSPPLADYIADKSILRSLSKLSLLPLIALSWYILKASLSMQILLIFTLILVIRKTIIIWRQQRRKVFI